MPGFTLNSRSYPNAALRLLQRELIGPASGAQASYLVARGVPHTMSATFATSLRLNITNNIYVVFRAFEWSN